MTVLVALCMSASVGQGAPTSAAWVGFVSHTTSVVPGGRVAVVVAVRGTAKRCVGVLRVGSKSLSRSALVRSRRASLAWTLPLSARPGGATVTVTCKPSGHVTTAVVVRAPQPPTPPVAPPAVTVQQSGFSTVTNDVDREMNFGVVLHETSGVQDALQVQVTANFLDPSGHIVDTEVNTIDRIPAGATFYYGGFGSAAIENPPPVALQVTAIVEEGQKATGVGLPPPANLHFFANDVGELEVQGEFTNPYAQTLTDLTEITYVLFDGAGKAISGGVTSTGADIPPGGQFGFDDSDTTVDPSAVASASASIDPALASP